MPRSTNLLQVHVEPSSRASDGTSEMLRRGADAWPRLQHELPTSLIGNIDRYGRQSRLYLNNGTGTFSDTTGCRLPVVNGGVSSLALGDIDRDSDLVIPSGRLCTNLLPQLVTLYVLHIGRSYQLDSCSRHGPATTTGTAFLFLSTGTASIPFSPFGTIGIDLTQKIALRPFVIPQPTGIGSLTLPIPNLPARAGDGRETRAAVAAGRVGTHPARRRHTA